MRSVWYFLKVIPQWFVANNVTIMKAWIYISSYGTELTISDSGEASYAEKSVGLTDGTDAGREAVKWYGVRNGLHLQKTNKNLRWYSVH